MSAVSKQLDELVHQIAQQKIGTAGSSRKYQSDPRLAQLKSSGSELWIDTGDLELAQSVWKTELTALTTNNTLANQVVQSGVMDQVIKETIHELKEVALSPEELVMEVGFVINCRIALRLVAEFRVKVSVELHPSISRDLPRTLDYGRRYFKVCPEYFTVKVPLTPEGYLSARQLRKEGIPVNFTLGFSARQNYLAARLSNPNFVNVFLGRLNAVVADNALGSGAGIGEKVTLATQNELLKVRQKFPAIQTRLIAASIRNGEQVACLAGVDVQTIPPKAMQEFQESGQPVEQIRSNLNAEIEVGVDVDHLWGSKVASLWVVKDGFIKFVDDLVGRDSLDQMSGEDLVRLAEDQGVNLFHRFSQADLREIQDHGKIPKLSEWPESVGLDDLMTHSALQSFTKDQDALDERIRSFLS